MNLTKVRDEISRHKNKQKGATNENRCQESESNRDYSRSSLKICELPSH